MKFCFKCNKEKSLTDFYKDKTALDGLNSKCILCTKKNNKKYNFENISKIKQYYQDNKDKEKLRSKLWKEKNKLKCKEFDKNHYFKKRKFKYKNDIQFTLKLSLRNRFNQVIKNYKGVKHTSVIELSGCSIDQLKQHLESKFIPPISWENWGKVWEIDHIIPCSSFDLTNLEQQKKCFHYTNLQPLFKTTEIAQNYGYLLEGNRNKSNK